MDLNFSSNWCSPTGGRLMRCLACNCNLTDREASRKFDNWEQIKNPESRFIMLCDDCILDTDLMFTEDPYASTEEYEDAEYPIDAYDLRGDND